MVPCMCAQSHEPRLVVVTGGPGAGKTAVLEMVRRYLCEHVRVLPEAASVVFGGGFPRHDDAQCRRAAQRAIFHVERELEAIGAGHNAAIVLCDRGTIDGLAYWPGSAEDFWAATSTTLEAELARYHAVIHLRTPTTLQGYNHQNPLRTESSTMAAAIDARILDLWARHPKRYLVDSTGDFLDKTADALAFLRRELPECCSTHLETVLATS